MKIVVWNCNGAFRNKYHLLENMKADILVIQECEDPALSTHTYREWADEYLWTGESKNKGIGIFSRSGSKLERLDWSDEGLKLFLPCRVNNLFNLVGVWTKQANSPNFRYIGQLWKYLQLHKDKLSANGLVLCGDLNSNSQWDEWDRWWNHSDVVRELEEINIHSLYHQVTGEEQGKETTPTLFMHRNREKPYHIDYAFISKSLSKQSYLEIGKPDPWLECSDHMPLTFTIACEQEAMERDMINFSQTLSRWGHHDFKTVVKKEIELLPISELPLQQGLTTGSYALDKDIEAMILNVRESESCIHVKAGIFYKAIIAGCSCSDDPTPIDECNEHCEIMVDIDKESGQATITLLPD